MQKLRLLVAPKTVEWVVLLFLLFTMLWRGGKTLESTWLLVGVAAYATFATYFFRRESPSKAEPGLGPWLLGIGFVGWTVLSFAYSSTQNYGLDEVLRDAALVLLFFWTIRTCARPQTGIHFRERLALTLTVGILLACVIGSAVYVLQPVSRFVGTFFNDRFHVDYWPNAWADMVLLCWPIAFFATRRMQWWVRGMILGLIVGCLFLSYSRGGVLAMGGQVILLFLIAAVIGVRKKRKPQLEQGFLILMTLAISAAVFFAGNAARSMLHQVESVAAKVTFTASEGNSSVSERQQFWNQSLALSLERPILGWGPYSFRFVQPRLQTDVFATSDHPHNVFLKLAMERGWPSVFLIAAFLLAVLGPVLWSRGLLILRGKDIDMFTIVAMTAIVGVLAHNLIDYNLQFVGIALPLWLLLGAIAAARPLRIPDIAVRIVEIGLAVLILSTAILEGRYLILSSLGRHAEAAGNTEEALEWYAKSEDEIFSRDMHLSSAALLLSDHRPDEALDSLRRYQRQNNEDARVWKLLGDTFTTIGNDDEALRAYDRAWELGKYNYIGTLQSILGTLRRTNDTAALEARRDEYEKIYRAFGEAILRNAHFIALSQNVEDFVAVGAILERVYPEKAAEFSPYTQRVLHHALEERALLRTQKNGILW